MITLILPGYSPNNREWSEENSRFLDLEGQIRPIFWDHWTEPEKEFDPKNKARILGNISKNLITNIVAKSIGCLVGSYIIRDHPEQIGKVVFCGLPLNDLNDEEKEVVKDALKTISPEKIICFQNEDDTHGTFEQVKDVIGKIDSEIRVVSKNGSDHEYPYYDEFQEFLTT